MNKKLLAVSWAMPPMAFPRSIQVSRLLAALSDLGWDITVVSGIPGDGIAAVDYTLDSLNYNRFSKVEVPLSPEIFRKADALTSQWLEPALHAVEGIIQDRQFELVVTFAQPWVDHLIGLELSKRYSIPWVAHFSDPWVDSIYYSQVPSDVLSQWRLLEEEIIREAQMVIWTNAEAMNLVMSKYPPSLQEKCRVLPHCYDSALIKRCETWKVRDAFSVRYLIRRVSAFPVFSKKCRLVYTGDLYGPRSPQPLFRALRKVLDTDITLANQLEVILVGAISSEYQHQVQELGIAQVIKIIPKVPYLESLRYAYEADVLLLLDAPISTPSPFLPSKLIDYLMFRKPILGLTQSVGASAELLQRLGCQIVTPDDVPAIAAVLNDVIDSWQRDALCVSPTFDQVAHEYDVFETGRQLDEALMQLIETTLDT